jgi:thiol:disulfide interchange protein DsbD
MARALDRRPAGRPVVLEFTADWCGACRSLEATVLGTPEVVKALRDQGHGVRVDLTGRTRDSEGLAARFHVEVLPAVRFLDAAGQELPALRLDGGMDSAMFRSALARAAGQDRSASR